MLNPYYAAFRSARRKERQDWHFIGFQTMRRLRSMYAYAIPNTNVMNSIAAWGPVVEMGAGTGYWASMLAQRGVDIVAYDGQPPDRALNDYHQVDHTWHPITIGAPWDLEHHTNRTLLLVWPPYATSMAADCLQHYQGDRLVYVGEGAEGCTGDDSFHQALQDWTLTDRVTIPQWPGIHDVAFFYTKGG